MPSRLPQILRLRLRSLFRRAQLDRELGKELQFHLDQQTEENLAQGMTRDVAKTAALRKLGRLAQVQEECRDMRQTQYIENFGRDLRYASRTLIKSPGFAITIILTLALSIGANSAIFSLINGVLLRPLPYPAPDRLVRIFFSSQNFPKFRLNPFDLRDFRNRNHSFDALAGYVRQDLQLSGTGRPESLVALGVTAGYFQTLGFQPIRGRAFEPNDELPGNSRVVVLSDRVWRTKFGADPNIIGQKLVLDSQPYTVVGVMPEGMQHPGSEHAALAHGAAVDLWWPFTFIGNPGNRGSHYLDGIGRLKKDVAIGQAEAELNLLVTHIARENPNFSAGWHVNLVPLYREIVGPSERMLIVLLAAVGLVLLIACVNAANLLLARASARQREISVRAALGASRGRLIRQMLAESLLISLLGAACGAVIAVGGVRALVALLPADFPRAYAIHVNAAVFAFTAVVALATGILFGLVPALQVSRTDLQQALRDGARGSTGGAGHQRFRNMLVVGEVSLAFVLLIGAGLMLRSFVNLLRMDPGFRPERVLTATVALPSQDYKTGDAIGHFFDQLTVKLASIPGVRSVGAGTDVPWTGYNENTGGFQIEGKNPPPHTFFHARYHAATSDYFRALGVPLTGGRFFDERDAAGSPGVMIVNQSMARKFWPGENVVGKRISFNNPAADSDWLRIVGVVGDIKDTPQSASAEPAFWWPVLQQQPSRAMSVVIRGGPESTGLAEQLRLAVKQLDPNLALGDVRLMDAIADASVSTPRFTLFLIGLFAVLALTLAAVGTYGVILYSVSQRTHEFGLRMALGAKPGDVLRLVLMQGIKLAVAGVITGGIGALALVRVMRSLLYDVSVADPTTFAAVSLIALVVAVLACYLPARKATSADPMTALRCE